jgi:hypothetical protein
MTSISTLRIVAAVIATSCIAMPASAYASDYSPPATFKSDAAQSDGDAKTIAGSAKSTFPPADFRGGDTPADYAGASRAQPAPTTVEVVRPERTIIRNVDAALPIVLSTTALVLVLAMFGVTLARTRLVPRPGRGH